MNNCCAVDSAEPTPCPQCRTIGPVIEQLPVRPHRVDPTEGPWQFCPNQQFPAIYYQADWGLCACGHLNPSRKCCLPNVRRAVKAALHRVELPFDDDVGDVSAV